MSSAGRRVRHIVLVKFKDDATPEQRAEFIARSQWSRSAGYVSGFECGPAVEPNPYAGVTEQWDWAMTLDVDEADVFRYKDDPVHRAVGADVGRYAANYSIIDIVLD
jgi:hypothetical protein